MRIGLIGTDSDHAEDLLRLMNRDRRWAGCEVAAMWGADRPRTQVLAAGYGVQRVVDLPADMMGEVDAVAVLSRHAGQHASQAMPFLAGGVPVLVDKMLAASVADADRMLEAAAKSGAPLLSASALRWQTDTVGLKREAVAAGGVERLVVTGSFYPDSPYGGSIFYGVHLVELAQELAGPLAEFRLVEAGEAALTIAGSAGEVAVEMRMLRPAEGEGSAFRVAVRTRAGEIERPIGLPADYMAPVFDRFVAMAQGEAPVVTPDQMLCTVRVLAFGEAELRRAISR